MGELHELLTSVNWSRARLAEKIGVDVKTVNRWCCREQEPKGVLAYMRLVARLHKNYLSLLG